MDRDQDWLARLLRRGKSLGIERMRVGCKRRHGVLRCGNKQRPRKSSKNKPAGRHGILLC
jgi:hypothetical protein